MKKILLIILSILLVFPIVISCSEKADNENISTETAAESSADTTAAETEMQSLLPSGLDFDGETIKILNCMYFVAESDNFMFNVTELSGDVVSDAVYERNLNTENQLNVKFELINKNLISGDAGQSLIKNSVLAGDKSFDMIFGIQYDCAPLVLDNMFYNLAGEEYLHLDQPWWASDYNNETSVGKDKLYFVSGDITLGLIRNMSCMYFNKSFYNDLFGDPETLYNMVVDGKWTFDQYAEYSKQSYKDLNGDGIADANDQFGCGVITSNLTDHLTFDAGMRVTTRNTDGIPELTMNNEKMINFTQKMYQLYYENSGIYIFPPTQEAIDVTIPIKFKANEMLFMLGWFLSSEMLRDMDVDYGILPYPKYDENQPTYLSLAHDVTTLACIPVTCDKIEMVTAVMETLAFEGYKNVIPAYYEIALKVKYVRDSTETALQIIDMIYENSTTDFAYVYNYALNSIGLIMRELMGGKKSDFVSAYTSKEKALTTKFNGLIDVYTSLN